MSVDPLFIEFPWNSSYAFAENDVIRCIDLEGLEKYSVTDVTMNGEPYVNITIQPEANWEKGEVKYGDEEIRSDFKTPEHEQRAKYLFNEYERTANTEGRTTGYSFPKKAEVAETKLNNPRPKPLVPPPTPTPTANPGTTQPPTLAVVPVEFEYRGIKIEKGSNSLVKEVLNAVKKYKSDPNNFSLTVTVGGKFDPSVRNNEITNKNGVITSMGDVMELRKSIIKEFVKSAGIPSDKIEIKETNENRNVTLEY